MCDSFEQVNQNLQDLTVEMDPVAAPALEFELAAPADASVQHNGNHTDELARLNDNDETMIDEFNGTASQARQSAINMASATSKILESSKQMAFSTREQASAVNQITCTVEEIKVSAEQVAKQAQGVSEQARHAALVALKGTEAANEASEGMGKIHSQVDEIMVNIRPLAIVP